MMSLFLGRDAGAEPASPMVQLEARIRHGSYWALGGSNEHAGGMAECLRGMMDDNPTKRWNAADLKRWTEGLVNRRIATDPGWTLSRPAVFEGKTYKDRRHLALAFLQSPRAAIAFAQSDRFRHWIEAALAEGPAVDWLDRAFDARLFEVQGDLTAIDEYMALARMMAVFFPEGPVCFGSLRFCPDGVVSALTMAAADDDGGRLELFREMASKGRLNAIADLLTGRTMAIRGAQTAFSAISSFLPSPSLGQGLERCLYELNKSLACQSPKLRGTYVDSLRKLALGLDAAAERGDIGGPAMDLHMAAFIVRHSSSFEGAISRLAGLAATPEAYAAEIIRILGLVQQNFCAQPLKNLARAMQPGLRKRVETLKSATRRRRVLAALDALVAEGNLIRLAGDLDLNKLMELDAREFAHARMQYAAIVRQQKLLEAPVQATHARVRADGYRMMAYVACLAVLVVTAMSLSQAYL